MTGPIPASSTPWQPKGSLGGRFRHFLDVSNERFDDTVIFMARCKILNVEAI